MEIKSQAKQLARNLMGELRSAASQYKFHNPEIDEELYFKEISRQFLHSFALEATTIVGIPNGLDIFRGLNYAERSLEQSSKDEPKKLN